MFRYSHSTWARSKLRERPKFALAILLGIFYLLIRKLLLTRVKLSRMLGIAIFAPLTLVFDIYRCFWRVAGQRSCRSSSHANETRVSESDFPGSQEFQRMLDKLEKSGLRSTASKAHEVFIHWIREELGQIPALLVTENEYEILRWQTKDGMSLHDAGRLLLGEHKISIAGAVPYSSPTTSAGVIGEVCHLSHNSKFHGGLKGKIVLRDLPSKAIPTALGFLPSYARTSDLNQDLLSIYERPSFWEHPMHNDLIAAGEIGAAGVIFLADLPRHQMESYWDPHQGTNYRIPALILGVDEASILKRATGQIATLTVLAEVSQAKTPNILVTLPGQISEQVIYASHTDGNTCVQENGVIALLTLARYFASQPLSSRRRTLQFAFNTAHLHVSKEGSGLHASQLDSTYDNGDAVLVIPIEHLGTRELEAFPRSGAPGRELHFTGRNELMLWCVGPSRPLVHAVEQVVSRRNLDRVLITRGTSVPKRGRLPLFDSLGGLGTLYHNCLVPTTSLISGPWSLFAPVFGAEAVDLERLRAQTLAVGDVYYAVEGFSREEIAGGYVEYRRRRAEGGKWVGFEYSPEKA